MSFSGLKMQPFLVDRGITLRSMLWLVCACVRLSVTLMFCSEMPKQAALVCSPVLIVTYSKAILCSCFKYKI